MPTWLWILAAVAGYALVGLAGLHVGHRTGFVQGWLCARYHDHVPPQVARAAAVLAGGRKEGEQHDA